MDREGATLRIYEDPYEDLFEQVSQYQVERANLNAFLSVKALALATRRRQKKTPSPASGYCVNLHGILLTPLISNLGLRSLRQCAALQDN